MAQTSKALVHACRLLRSRVRLRRASIQLPGTPFNKDDTPAVREALRIYVETWIVPIIDSIEKGTIARDKWLWENEPVGDLIGSDYDEPEVPAESPGSGVLGKLGLTDEQRAELRSRQDKFLG